MELYISQNGAKISKIRNNFFIKTEEEKYLLSSDKIDSIIIESECSITAGVIRLAFEKDIPIVISDNYGNMMGQFYRTSGTNNGKLKKAQYKFFTSDLSLEIAKNWIIEKLLNQKQHMEKLLKKRKISIDILKEYQTYINKIENIKINNKENRNLIMGYEGIATKLYFKCISNLLENKWKFEKREHQKAKSPYNIVLNYTLGILYRKLETLLLKEGFDNSVGILHSEGENKLPLLYDFIEKYRIFALETTFLLFNNNKIKDEYFIYNSTKILTIEGRKNISRSFNETLQKKVNYNGKKYSIEDTISFEIKKFKEMILESKFD